MNDPIIPIIRIPVDPALVVKIDHGRPFRVGGVRVKTTVYVVTEPDMPGAKQTVQTVTIPVHAKVELRIVE